MHPLKRHRVMVVVPDRSFQCSNHAHIIHSPDTQYVNVPMHHVAWLCTVDVVYMLLGLHALASIQQKLDW